jgi:RNA polymerase sigma factor (sigma-70 family)
LVDEYLRLVYGCALRQVKDAKLAEDVAQSVFLVAVKRSGVLPGEWAAAWLVKVTRYVAIATLRAEARRRKHEKRAAELNTGVATRSNAVQSSDFNEMLSSSLDDGLAALRESDRQLIVMRYLQERSVRDISLLLGISENTAAKRLQRALGRIRVYFRGRGITVEEAALGAALAGFKQGSIPAQLGARILQIANSGAGASGGVILPMGVRLMLASFQTKLVVVLVLLLMIVGGTVVGVQWAQSGGGDAKQQGPVAPAIPVQASQRVVVDAPGTVTLRGVVKDTNGAVLSNILVSQGSAVWIEGYKSTRTNANGEFVLRGIPIGSELVLAAQGDRVAPELRQGIVSANPDPFSFTMTPGKTLRFRVVDERGKPVAGLEIDPREWRGTYVIEASEQERDGRRRFPHTNTDGVVELRNAPADAVTFDPICDDHYLRKTFTLTASDHSQTVVLRDPIKVSLKVVDDASGEPIANFKVVEGYGSADSVNYWYQDPAKHGKDGVLNLTINWELAPRRYYRVEAAGYEPAIQNLGDEKDSAELLFRLKKEGRPEISVVKPDGSPAAGVEVYCVEPSTNFSLESSQVLRDPREASEATEILKTDAGGRARLKGNEPAGTRVVVLGSPGIAVVAYSDAIGQPVKLDAWASLKGRAMIGREPARNAAISLSYVAEGSPPPYVTGLFSTTADGDGAFEFPRVPPGKALVGRWIETNLGSQFAQGTMASGNQFELKPGESAIVNVGGVGRPVIGCVVFGSSATAGGVAIRHVIYSLGMVRGGPGGPTPPEMPASLEAEMRKALATLGPQREAALAKYRRDQQPYEDAWQAWLAKLRDMAFIVGSDGRFRVDDVEPGDYSMSVEVTNADNMRPIGAATTRFSVPEMSGGRSDDALDIGELAVEAAKTTGGK